MIEVVKRGRRTREKGEEENGNGRRGRESGKVYHEDESIWELGGVRVYEWMLIDDDSSSSSVSRWFPCCR